MRSAPSGPGSTIRLPRVHPKPRRSHAPHACQVSLVTGWRASVWLYIGHQRSRSSMGLRRRRVEPHDGATARAERAPGNRARTARGSRPSRPYARGRCRRRRARQRESQRPPRRTPSRLRSGTPTGGSPPGADRSRERGGDHRSRHRRADGPGLAAHRTPRPRPQPCACSESSARRRAAERAASAGLTARVASINEGIRGEVGRRRQHDLTSKDPTTFLEVAVPQATPARTASVAERARRAATLVAETERVLA